MVKVKKPHNEQNGKIAYVEKGGMKGGYTHYVKMRKIDSRNRKMFS